MQAFSRVAILGMLAGGGFVLSAQAQVVVEISGVHGKSEGSCTHINKVIGGYDCTYGGTNLEGTGEGWSGPSLGAVYYAAGSAGDSPTYVPVPGDARIAPAITGQLVVTGTGPGATVGGTIVVGAGARNIGTDITTRAVQRWTTITHTLAATTVSSAVANGAGGFDYVIGSRGAPEQICLAGGGACFGLHETGAGATTGPVDAWGVGGVGGVKPTVGISKAPRLAGAVATGTTDQTNVGATTTAVIAGDSCDATGVSDCASSILLWGRGEDPGWDNLIVAFSTNAAGDITSGRAYWTQDYRIPIGPNVGDNSDSEGTFTFTGVAAPACTDFAATVLQDTSNNAIDALGRCSNFGAGVTISIVSAPLNGTASVSGGNILYTPGAGFTGTDTLTYNGNDGTDNDDGIITITVAAPNDTVPDAFSFSDVAGLPVSSVVVSNTVTVTGLTASSPITVTGGEYSINDGEFTAADGTVVQGDTVAVRLTTSASASTAANATLTIGGVADTFTATTAPDTQPDQFTFDDQDGVDQGAVIVSDPVTITGISSPAAIAVTNGDYSIGCTGTFTADPGTITGGQTVCVRHTSASTAGSAVTTQLTIGTAPATTVDSFTSATRRAGGGGSMDGLALGLLGLIAVYRGRRPSPGSPSPVS